MRTAVEVAAAYFEACTELAHKVMSAEDGLLEAFVVRTPTLQMLYFDVVRKWNDCELVSAHH